MQQHYSRCVEVHTTRATCDDCGASAGPAARDTLRGWGWHLTQDRDTCPDCTEGRRQAALREEEDAARARLIARLEDEEPLLVHGRIFTEAGTLHAREDIEREIERALASARNGR